MESSEASLDAPFTCSREPHTHTHTHTHTIEYCLYQNRILALQQPYNCFIATTQTDTQPTALRLVWGNIKESTYISQRSQHHASPWRRGTGPPSAGGPFGTAGSKAHYSGTSHPALPTVPDTRTHTHAHTQCNISHLVGAFIHSVLQYCLWIHS